MILENIEIFLDSSRASANRNNRFYSFFLLASLTKLGLFVYFPSVDGLKWRVDTGEYCESGGAPSLGRL
jgi:hypothetical protein